MSAAADLDRWWAEHQANERRRAEGERARWLAEHEYDEPPELEFPYPLCSVCGLDTYHDSDSFRCDPCGISWSDHGPGAFDECESQGPKNGPRQWDRRWCRLRKGHAGACSDGEARWDEDDNSEVPT